MVACNPYYRIKCGWSTILPTYHFAHIMKDKHKFVFQSVTIVGFLFVAGVGAILAQATCLLQVDLRLARTLLQTKADYLDITKTQIDPPDVNYCGA